MRYILLFLSVVVLNSSTLKLSISSNPSRLNPILSTDSASSMITNQLFNGLFKYDKDGNIVYDLALSHYFENNTTLIVKIKPGVLWHDGEPMDAYDILWTYEKIIDPKIFTPHKTYFEFVKKVEVVDSLTIKVVYKKPYFKALHIWMMGILPRHILKDEKDLMTSKFNKQPIGTGAYKLKSWKTSQDILLVRNDNYFGPIPKIETISYKFLPDSNTQFFALKQQSLDIGTLSPLQIDRQIDKKFKKNFQIVEKQSFSYTYMGLNLKNPKFKDIRVRQALDIAIDKKQLIDILFFGHGKISFGPFLPNSFAFDDKIKPSKYDPKKAKKLLKQAGYDSKNPLSFTLITNANNPTRVYAAQIIQHQLKKVGIDISIRVMEWQAFLNTIVSPRNYEAILLGWGLSLMPDAKPLWHSSSATKGGFNLVYYDNKKVDKLIDQGAKTIDRAKLSKIYKDIFRQIVNDKPYIFLYIPNSITVIDKDIQYIEPSFTGIWHNQHEWIKP